MGRTVSRSQHFPCARRAEPSGKPGLSCGCWAGHLWKGWPERGLLALQGPVGQRPCTSSADLPLSCPGLQVPLTDSLTQGLCGGLHTREMEDNSASPGSVRSRPLLGFTLFLISLHVQRLDSGRIPGALGSCLSPTEASGSAGEGWAPSLSSVGGDSGIMSRAAKVAAGGQRSQGALGNKCVLWPTRGPTASPRWQHVAAVPRNVPLRLIDFWFSGT